MHQEPVIVRPLDHLAVGGDQAPSAGRRLAARARRLDVIDSREHDEPAHPRRGQHGAIEAREHARTNPGAQHTVCRRALDGGGRPADRRPQRRRQSA
jgi:hypothetical protein